MMKLYIMQTNVTYHHLAYDQNPELSLTAIVVDGIQDLGWLQQNGAMVELVPLLKPEKLKICDLCKKELQEEIKQPTKGDCP